MKKKIGIGFIIVAILIFDSAALIWAVDDFQYWSFYTFKIVDRQKVDFDLHSQVRFNHDAKDTLFYMVSPRLIFDYWKNLSLGLNYSYLETKVNNSAAKRSEYNFHHRLEMEVNPHAKLTDWLKVHLRNRIELRWIENKGSYNTRSRHRLNFEIPVKGLGVLKSIYANTELFYDIAEHEYNENRTVPLGVKFELNPKTTLSVFHMIQSRLGADDWLSNQVLGTHLMVKF